MKPTLSLAVALGSLACLLTSPAARADADGTSAKPPQSLDRCLTCHVTLKGVAPTVGPNLFGVGDTRAGSRPGYAYSAAMKASGLVWNEATLDRFIASPQATVPGTKMTFLGLHDPKARAEIVAYLLTLRSRDTALTSDGCR